MGANVVGSDYCKQCGQLFWQFDGKGRPRQFCSNACKQRHWRAERRRLAKRRAYPWK